MSRFTRPPYVDPTTNMMYETNQADFEGYLTKQSQWLKVRSYVSPTDKDENRFFVAYERWLNNFQSICVLLPNNGLYSPLFFPTVMTVTKNYYINNNIMAQDWRRRFFILKGSKLFFSKSEFTKPHGMIDLSTCTTVKSADLKSRKRNSFEISTPEFTYLLYADSEKEKDDWIGSVGRSIVRCSSTYQGNMSGSGRDDMPYDSDSDYSNSSNNPYFN